MAQLVAQLDGLVARQRDGALRQATTQVSVERGAAVDQLGATITAQQDLLTRNLRTVTDESIDRLFALARTLVLVTVVSICLACVLFRRIAGARRERKA